MKKLVVILSIFLMTFSSYSQETSIKLDTLIKDIRKNSIFLELGGNGYLYSINYERVIPISGNKRIGLRIGYSKCDLSFSVLEKYLMVPLEINSISGEKHCLEIGCELTLAKRTKERNNTIISERNEILVFRIGYKCQADSGFLFRFAPLLMTYNENNIIFCAGISVGRSF
jgi:hypothetical protein